MEQNANGPPKILVAEEVAAYLCVNVQTIYRMVEHGEIPHFRIGRSIRFSSSELETWIHRHD